MAFTSRTPDFDTLHKLCEVLSIDPTGLVEITINWDMKSLVTYTAKYIHAGRGIGNVEVADSPKSWRDDPQL